MIEVDPTQRTTLLMIIPRFRSGRPLLSLLMRNIETPSVENRNQEWKRLLFQRRTFLISTPRCRRWMQLKFSLKDDFAPNLLSFRAIRRMPHVTAAFFTVCQLLKSDQSTCVELSNNKWASHKKCHPNKSGFSLLLLHRVSPTGPNLFILSHVQLFWHKVFFVFLSAR